MIEKGYAEILYHIWILQQEILITAGDFAHPGYGQKNGRKAVYFSVVTPLDQNLDPKYKLYTHAMYVIALEAAQNSLDIYQTANGCGVCYNTVPSEVFKKIINLQDGKERFMKEKKTHHL